MWSMYKKFRKINDPFLPVQNYKNNENFLILSPVISDWFFSNIDQLMQQDAGYFLAQRLFKKFDPQSRQSSCNVHKVKLEEIKAFELKSNSNSFTSPLWERARKRTHSEVVSIRNCWKRSPFKDTWYRLEAAVEP